MKSETITAKSVLPRPAAEAVPESNRSVVIKMVVGLVVLVVLVSLLLAGVSLLRLLPSHVRDITYVALGLFGYIACDVLGLYTRWVRQGAERKP